MVEDFLIKSLRVEKKLTYNDRYEQFQSNEFYILNCIGDNKEKYEIVLWTNYGDCYSGYCGASWGHGNIRKVKEFSGMTHKVKNSPLKINARFNEISGELADQDNDVFNLDYGWDSYYPCGEANLKMELFEEINRNKEKRPVWIFKGESNLGKSYLASIILNAGCNKEVYETDSSKELREIHEEIIVLGNKYQFSIDEIEEKIIGEHELIVVDFTSR